MLRLWVTNATTLDFRGPLYPASYPKLPLQSLQVIGEGEECQKLLHYTALLLEYLIQWNQLVELHMENVLFAHDKDAE